MSSWTVQIYLGVALILGVAGFLMWLPQNNFAVQNTMDTKVDELRYRRDLKIRKVPQTEYQMIQKREMTKEEKARLIFKYKALKKDGIPLDILHGIPLDIQVPLEKDLKIRKVPQTEYQMIQKMEMTKEEKARLLFIKSLKNDYELHGIPLDIQVPSEKVKKPSLLEKNLVNLRPLMVQYRKGWRHIT